MTEKEVEGSMADVILSFFLYGFLGWCSEVAFAAVRYRKFVNRGFLNGPICPIYGFGVISVVLMLYDYQSNLIGLYCLSVVVATLLEWITGVVLERLFHHRWWDYSDMPFNIQGYICLPFSLLWGIACVLVVRFLFPLTQKIIWLLPEVIQIILIGIFLLVFLADLYVTVHEIFRLNMKLEKMQEITDELEAVSVHLGENLSKGVIHAVDRRKMLRHKVEERYQEHVKNLSYTNKRLLQAFPAIRSLRYKKQLQILKEYLDKKRAEKES